MVDKINVEDLSCEYGIYRRKIKVFLGGTCNSSVWRERFIKTLKLDYFNPVVKNWTEECKKIEEQEKLNSDFQLYVITPKMTGVFSIAEVVDSSNKQPKRTIFCILNKDGKDKFDAHQKSSLESVKILVKNNGSHVFDNLKDVTEFLNQFYME